MLLRPNFNFFYYSPQIYYFKDDYTFNEMSTHFRKVKISITPFLFLTVSWLYGWNIYYFVEVIESLRGRLIFWLWIWQSIIIDSPLVFFVFVFVFLPLVFETHFQHINTSCWRQINVGFYWLNSIQVHILQQYVKYEP